MLETKNHVHRCFTTIPWRSQNTVLSGSLSVHQGSGRPSVHSWSDSLVDARHLHVEQGWPSSLHCQGDDGGKMLTTARSNFTQKLDVITNLVPEQGKLGLGGAAGSSTLLLLQGLQTCWADDQGQQVPDWKTEYSLHHDQGGSSTLFLQKFPGFSSFGAKWATIQKGFWWLRFEKNIPQTYKITFGGRFF